MSCTASDNPSIDLGCSGSWSISDRASLSCTARARGAAERRRAGCVRSSDGLVAGGTMRPANAAAHRLTAHLVERCWSAESNLALCTATPSCRASSTTVRSSSGVNGSAPTGRSTNRSPSSSPACAIGAARQASSRPVRAGSHTFIQPWPISPACTTAVGSRPPWGRPCVPPALVDPRRSSSPAGIHSSTWRNVSASAALRRPARLVRPTVSRGSCANRTSWRIG